MRLLAVLLIGFVAVHSTTGSPFIFDILSQINSGLKGITNGAGDFAQNLINGAGQTANGFADMAHGIATGVINIQTDIGKGVAAGAQGFAIAVLDTFQNVTTAFDNAIKTQLNTFTSSVLQRVVGEVRNRLQEVSERMSGLIAIARAKQQAAQNFTNELVNSKRDELNKWGELQKLKLENATAENQQLGEDIIDGYIETSANALKACADSFANDVQAMVNQTGANIEGLYPIVNDLVKKVEECSQLPASDFWAAAQCAREIREKLAPLSGIPSKVDQFRQQLEALAVGNINQVACMSTTLAKINSDRTKVEQEIEQLAS